MTKIAMIKRWGIVLLTSGILQGCSSWKAFYGENWAEDMTCYSRDGDLCGTMKKIDQIDKK